MDRNEVRRLLLRIGEIKCNKGILIDDLHKEFESVPEEDFIDMISSLATRYVIRIEGKYSMDCYTLEKYNKIAGLEREGYVAIDAVCNDKIWNMTEKFLKDNEYDNFSFLSAIEIAKKIIEKEIDNIVKK